MSADEVEDDVMQTAANWYMRVLDIVAESLVEHDMPQSAARKLAPSLVQSFARRGLMFQDEIASA